MKFHLDHNIILLVLTTESNYQNAKKLAGKILEKKLSSCINFSKISSIYWWEDKLNEESEMQIYIKVKPEDLDQLYNVIKENHSYDIPEFICMNTSASDDYFKWHIDSLDR